MKKIILRVVLILIFGSVIPFITNADELPTCTASDWSCADWGACHADGNWFQNRTCSKTTSCEGGVASPSTQQICTPPFCTSYTYSDWSSCDPVDRTQERTNISNFPNDCIIDFSGNNPGPITRQRCTITNTITSPPICTSWTYSDWSSCSSNGNQTRSVTSSLPSSCVGGSPVVNQSCTYTPSVPSCTAANWSCGDWGVCSQNGNQTRTCSKISNCQGGVSSPTTSQSCTFVTPVTSCTTDKYDCGEWGACSTSGFQTRNCNKISDCPGVVHGPQAYLGSQSCTPPSQPIKSLDQQCKDSYGVNTVASGGKCYCSSGYIFDNTSNRCVTPKPSCTEDIWACDNWSSCSLSGIQNRSCKKTFDCSSVETAPPTVDQYCEAPSKPAQQVPQDSDAISNQDTIIKATVKLYCPFDDKGEKWSQGSGTVINPNGTILTNKHVVLGTLECLIGFINNFEDEPYFGERQIADITKVSPNQDIAILKIRNPQNKKLLYIDITGGTSNDLRLGDRISIYGYPGVFGANITYTSGDFSGTRSDSYLKTTAILEHGNSGGGAYIKNGTFIGIPSEVTVKVKNTVNVLGYILPINIINTWLSNSNIVYNNQSNNEYSRVSSILENIDLKNLRSIKLLIPNTDKKGDIAIPTAPTTSTKNQNSEKAQKLNNQTFQFTRTLKKGVNGNEVMELQKRLTAEGVYNEDITGYFGTLTEVAVKAYQKKYGINTLGFVGPSTMVKLNSSPTLTQNSIQKKTPSISKFNFTKNLGLMSEGKDVIELQKRLTIEGVYNEDITGYFGTLTKAAVKKYQTAHGITPQNGLVGSLTRIELNK